MRAHNLCGGREEGWWLRVWELTEDDEAWVIFGGMGTELRIEEFWEDGEGRWWRTKMPSCAPDLLDEEGGGGGEGQCVCSLLSSSLYLFWITVNIWPFCFSFWLLHIFTLHPLLSLPLFHMLSLNFNPSLSLHRFLFSSTSVYLLLFFCLTLYYTQHTYAQRADVNSYIKTPPKHLNHIPLTWKYCLLFFIWSATLHSVLLKPTLQGKSNLPVKQCKEQSWMHA